MQDTWTIEMKRVERFGAEAIEELAAEGGDIDVFALLLMSFAVQLNTRLHGPEALEAAITRIAAEELVRAGMAASC